ncbi:MAG TPA: ArsC family (seleno)protein [Gemmataceae bacterium]|jgi:arsenate reductase-like glutaredoxin family protein
MPKTIDWLYFRKSCVTCQKAKKHIDAGGISVKETVDARTVRYGDDEALALLDGIHTLTAMRGARIETFNLKKDRPDDAALLAKLIGPSGNLRAPTARVGATLLVGYNPDAYRQALGA